MTNKQKRFKIQKKESYEAQISKEEKNATNKTFLFGLAAAAAVCCFNASANVNIDNVTRIVYSCLGMLNTGLGSYHLKGLIESISKKTMLQGKVEDINNNLLMPENEESRGMRR